MPVQIDVFGGTAQLGGQGSQAAVQVSQLVGAHDGTTLAVAERIADVLGVVERLQTGLGRADAHAHDVYVQHAHHQYVQAEVSNLLDVLLDRACR